MKNTLKKLIAVALAALMLFALVSCDKSNAVKKAFEEEGYTVKTVDATDSTAKGILSLLLSEEQMEKAAEYEIMLVTMDGLLNVGKTAVVIKFPGSGDVKDFLTVEKDGEKDTSKYDEAKEAGNVNGNCLLITASDDTRTVFKKA